MALMFETIALAVLTWAFATLSMVLYFKLRDERDYSSALDKLYDMLSDSLSSLMDLNLEECERRLHLLDEKNLWHQHSNAWRDRAFAERTLRRQERLASEVSINLLSDEIDNLNIAHAKYVLHADEVEDVQAADNGMSSHATFASLQAVDDDTMITPGGTPHQRDEWCDRFSCSPVSTAPFVNDTGEDVEIPVDYYTVDRGE